MKSLLGVFVGFLLLCGGVFGAFIAFSLVGNVIVGIILLLAFLYFYILFSAWIISMVPNIHADKWLPEQLPKDLGPGRSDNL